jgi:hypothetical protein
MKIEGITLSSASILNCYKKFYPKTYNTILKNRFYELQLFGIRLSTCDTSMPDDLIGGLVVNRFNLFEVVVSKGSTEPSPKNIAELYDAEARRKGGAAFMKEGQYIYRYRGRKNGRFAPLPSFCPIVPTTVYRWMPTNEQIKSWNRGKGVPLSKNFEQAIKDGLVKISTSTDTCIHKSWSKDKFFSDSAGCQILTDDKALSTLGTWAEEHMRKKYGNNFTYTLFTKEQFVSANTTNTVTNLLSMLVPKKNI